MASSARIEELERKFSENPRRYFAPLANEYRKAGDLTQAISICRTYVPQQPGHMSGQIVFGQALFEAGEFDESRTVFESALQLDPENLIALRQLGDIARERGEIGSARAWYGRVLDADPRNDEIAALVASLDGLPETPVRPEPVRGVDAAPPDGLNGWHDINPERTLELPQSLAETAQRLSGVTDWTGVKQTPAPPAATEAVAAIASPAAVASAAASASSAPAPATTDAAPDAPALADAAAPDHGASVMPIGHEPVLAAADATVAAPVAASTSHEPAVAASTAPFEGFYSDAMTATESVSASPPADASGLGLEVMEFVPPVRASSGRSPVESPPSGDRPSAFVTETMAELYLQQGFHAEALEVYRQLLAQNPGDDTLRDRVAQLERGSRSSVGSAADVSDSVIEAASQRQQAPSTRSVRAFFGELAARRVVVRHADRAPSVDLAAIAPEPARSTDGEVAVAVPVAQEGPPRPSGDNRFVGSASAGTAAIAAPVTDEASPLESSSAVSSSIEASPVASAAVETAPSDAWPGDSSTVESSTVDPSPLEAPAVEPASPHHASTGDSGATVPSGAIGSEAGFFEPDPYAATGFDVSAIATGAPGESSLAEPEFGGDGLVSRRRDEVDEFGLPVSGDTESFTFDAGDATAEAAPAPRTSLQTGSVDVLFPDTPVVSDDEAAASTLSAAFGGPSPSPEVLGAPVRRASTELSLDSVFRETPPPGAAPGRRDASAFSFDQFFGYDPFAEPDATGARGPVSVAGEGSGTPTGASETPAADGGPTASGPTSGGAAETEQFSSWLSGLKKK
jgi:tetratricopeptide (TPR) repeat protein